MPFALLVLSGDGQLGPAWVGPAGAGAGLPAGRRRPAHDADRRPGAGHRPRAGATSRPRVVALLYVMLLLGMVGGGSLFALLLADFSDKQADPGDAGRGGADRGAQPARAVEAGGARPRAPPPQGRARARPSARCGARFIAQPGRAPLPVGRRRWAPPPSACRTSCSSPTAARSCSLGVGATSALTALLAGGTLAAFALAARAADARRRPAAHGGATARWSACRLRRRDLRRTAGIDRGCSAPAPSLIGFGGGLFAVGTLTAAMAWSAPSTSASRSAPGAPCRPRPPASAIALGGALRDARRRRSPRRACSGSALTSAGHRLRRRLSPRDRAAVRHPDRPRTAGAPSGAPRVDRRTRPVSAWPTCPARHHSRQGDLTMGTGAITQYIDVAQLVLYVFWIFFAGLIYYLRARGQARGLSAGDRARPRRHARAGRHAGAQDLPAARTAARSRRRT